MDDINRTNDTGDERSSPLTPSASLSVSVVIPTRNRSAKIGRLLERLTAGDDDIEVVVVDDHSTDGTFETLQTWSARDARIVPLRSESSGHAAGARKQGARTASGQVLVMLDDDVMPMPGLALAHGARHGRRDKTLVLGYMPTRVPDPIPPGAFATVLYAQEYEVRCAEYEADPTLIMTGLWLGNASVLRDTYLDALEPGRMPTFPYRHEDRILGIILRDLGVVGVFDRNLRADHEHSRTVSAFLRDSYLNGQGRAEIYRTRPDVLPEDPVQLYLKGLPGPMRRVASATRHDAVRKVVTGSLVGGIRAAGTLRSQRAELVLARLARKVEQLHGARDLLAPTTSSA